jgi:hypothetical protein
VARWFLRFRSPAFRELPASCWNASTAGQVNAANWWVHDLREANPVLEITGMPMYLPSVSTTFKKIRAERQESGIAMKSSPRPFREQVQNSTLQRENGIGVVGGSDPSEGNPAEKASVRRSR